ncbi:MAG: SRPBCC domain-containing protein [Sphingomicrobium sp.]
MSEPLITVDTLVDADPAAVWETRTQKKSAMFMGADVETDWQPGSPIRFSGEFHGKAFEDTGEIRSVEPLRRLAFTHFSGGRTENGNLVDIRLEPRGERTELTLSQTPLGSPPTDHATVAEFRNNWQMMLDALRNAAEQRSSAAA